MPRAPGAVTTSADIGAWVEEGSGHTSVPSQGLSAWPRPGPAPEEGRAAQSFVSRARPQLRGALWPGNVLRNYRDQVKM